VRAAGPVPAALVDVLTRARRERLLGPAPLERQIDHAAGFAAAVAMAAGADPALAVDLGSGGGLPGLVLAHCWSSSSFVLIEASARRARFLTDAVATLALGHRVSVVHARVETAGRSELRGTADVVTARAFGPPAVVAECGAPLLREGGFLIVSEPPHAPMERWPPGIAALGLEDRGLVRAPDAYRILVQAQTCPDRFPRRPGVPQRRPLL
jgi:16S rRNA (guanine527-N7)-methyltransferase